jgi:hypothetical protein
MSPPHAYQLKILLRGIKPPVWRRVVVSGDTTISFLHEILQVAMGWYNCHLHNFLIRGKEYGVSYEGGVSFADDPDQVRLADFGFRPQERFEYVYDFGDNWEHQISVEKIPAPDETQYPICITGRGNCPPEDSGGPWMYMTRRQGRPARRDRKDETFDVEGVNRLLRELHTGWLKRTTNID